MEGVADNAADTVVAPTAALMRCTVFPGVIVVNKAKAVFPSSPNDETNVFGENSEPYPHTLRVLYVPP